jgi:hypothetical protein
MRAYLDTKTAVITACLRLSAISCLYGYQVVADLLLAVDIKSEKVQINQASFVHTVSWLKDSPLYPRQIVSLLVTLTGPELSFKIEDISTSPTLSYVPFSQHEF